MNKPLSSSATGVQTSEWLVVGMVFLLAIVTQYFISVHGDVLYLIEVASYITQGKQYGIDFFETNPPMILYLSRPVLWLMKTGLSMPASLQIYIFSLFALVLALVVSQLTTLVPDKLVRHTMLGMILFISLFFPAEQFAQREHLFLVLTLPYILMVVERLDKRSIALWRALLVGLLAGLGFGLKPYFLCPLVLLECWMIYQRGSMWGWVRTESIVVLLMLVTYLFSILAFYPTYFTIMLPMLKTFYFSGMFEPWMNIFTDYLVIFSIAVFFGAWYLFGKLPGNYQLKMVLQISLAGMIIALLMTQTRWFYHLIPSLGMACILASYYFGALVARYCKQFNAMALVAGLIIFSPVLNPTFYRTYYVIDDAYHGDFSQIQHYLAQQAGDHSLTCFAITGTHDCFPAALTTQSVYGSRYPFFWWLPGLLNQLDNDKLSSVQREQYKNYFCESVAWDLNHFKPRWVIINPGQFKNVLGNNFEIIHFLAGNKQFDQAWSHYGLKKQSKYYVIYERRAAL